MAETTMVSGQQKRRYNMINIEDIKSVKKYNWDTDWNYQVELKSGGTSGVPNDTANTDCLVVLEWSKVDGNTIADAD